DDDARRHRTAVELQRIVEHSGVPPHDRVLDAAQQEAPTADLHLGSKPETSHPLLADTQAGMDRGDRSGHVLTVDLAELLDAKTVEVERTRQPHVPTLLTCLHQLPGIP